MPHDPELKEHGFIGWMQVWVRAFNNTPARIGTQRTTVWVECAEKVPIGDYIKGVARKRMRLTDGKVERKVSRTYKFTYGKQAALTKILGWHTKKYGHYRVSRALYDGTRPRDPATRKLLLSLAGPDGTRLAREILDGMGIGHRYRVKK